MLSARTTPKKMSQRGLGRYQGRGIPVGFEPRGAGGGVSGAPFSWAGMGGESQPSDEPASPPTSIRTTRWLQVESDDESASSERDSARASRHHTSSYVQL